MLRKVTKTYGSRFGSAATRALRGVSLAVEAGEFVAVMGPSGSGKTTLLNLVAGLDRPDGGELAVAGRNLSRLGGDALGEYRRTSVGFLFQDSALLDTLTAEENIAFPLALVKAKPEVLRSRVAELGRALGISEILGKYPAELSGGQRQRVAAARALAVRPALLLADEPTGALDSRTGRELLELLARTNCDDGSTILLVTHDPWVAAWAGRVLFLRDGSLFTELRAGGDRASLFERILEVQASYGGSDR